MKRHVLGYFGQWLVVYADPHVKECWLQNNFKSVHPECKKVVFRATYDKIPVCKFKRCAKISNQVHIHEKIGRPFMLFTKRSDMSDFCRKEDFDLLSLQVLLIYTRSDSSNR